MSQPKPTLFVYLSDEWLAAVDAELADLTPLDAELRLGFRILGSPGGESAHQLVLGPDRVGAERGLDGAVVTMTMIWDVAVEIARGVTSAQRAFLDGRMQLGGDPGALLGHQAQLAEIDDRLGAIRSTTSYC